MIKSLFRHIYVFFIYENDGKWIFAGITLLVVGGFIFLCYKKEYGYWSWIIEKIIYIFVSVVLWGLVASPPTRGIYIALVYLFLIYAKIIYKAEKLLNKKAVILLGTMALVILVRVIVDCSSWIPSMVIQSHSRETIIAEAAANHAEYVYVPRYTDECNRRIFELKSVDSQDELDWLYNIRMYGTHVIIED